MTNVPIVTHDIDIENIVPPKAHELRTFNPDHATEKKFRDAMAYLVFKWQLFAQMIYSGMEIAYTYDVPIAATDSHTIFINPMGFEDHEIVDVLEIVFVFGHEVGHRILNHLALAVVWRKTGQVLCPKGPLPYDQDLMNQAMDYIVNAMLVSSGLGKMPKCGLYDKNISASGMESCVEIYEKLYKSGGGRGPGKKPGKPGNQPGGTPQPGQGSQPGDDDGGFDIHIEPTDEQILKDKGKREQEIVAACQIAERTNPGSVPAAVNRILQDIVDPKVPWEQHLKASMTRKAGEPKLDWRYLNRRLAGRQPSLFFAKRGHRGAGLIVAVGDNSGSIGDKQANVFGSEMSGIVKDLNPMQFIVLWCDAAITRTDIVDDPQDLHGLFADWKKTGVGGGGGTDFRPVFEWIEEQGLLPDMLVYFTDGQGTFPSKAPDYPVIWASIYDTKYPFGEVVNVEIK